MSDCENGTGSIVSFEIVLTPVVPVADNRELWQKLGFKTCDDYIKSFRVLIKDENDNWVMLGDE